MKPIVTFFALLLFFRAGAQDYQLHLWPSGKIPNAQPSSDREKSDTTDAIRISLVQDPTLTVYLPSKRSATGQAVIICPGGGYARLAFDIEGTDPARWLNAHGIAAIILKYRLPVSKSNIVPNLSPLMDAQRALRIVRYNAEKWGIKKDRIGIMGFSAGGHLAATLETHFDAGNKNAADPVEKESARPDFAILMYPVITMRKPVMHEGSRNNLIGEHPDSALARNYSNELQVTAQTPPTFIVHATDDRVVPVENSLMFYQALKDHGVPVEMHIFPRGGHGFGLALGKGELAGWTSLCISWLQELLANGPKTKE